ncbi:MAG: two-component sensor histidine kinase [Rhodocyclaceae bacterium]|nr:MAG: two-component sensor histidine kinase [Rhodocyclaceae bacterium]
MNTAWFSLRRRLLIPLLGGVTSFWLATLGFSFIETHHEVDELFDAQLVQTAQTLLAIASNERGDVAEIGEAGHKYQQKLSFQIWNARGRLVLHSSNAPQSPMTSASGFSEGPGWRYYSQWDAAREFQVQVGESHEIRDELVSEIAWQLLVPALLGLPLLGGWVWLATRRGLAPLDAVAAQIGNRDPSHLEPLAPARAPLEIKPLMIALNDLLKRVGQALETERRFTADAAHELRTPLAALAVQAHVAQRSTNDAERQHAIEQLRAGVDRAAHLVDQLLTLARLDPEQPFSDVQSIQLKALTEEICAAHGAAAVAKNIALELDAVDVEVRGNKVMLQILMRNLIDNAIRYTQAGGLVKVTVSAAGPTVFLRVSDNGPGISAEERGLAFERFHRGAAGQDQVGSGLGLSIARRIAELHDAQLGLDEGEAGRGLSIIVKLPMIGR